MPRPSAKATAGAVIFNNYERYFETGSENKALFHYQGRMIFFFKISKPNWMELTLILSCSNHGLSKERHENIE